MKFKTLNAALAACALLASGSALADFGVGIKAGTLGLGVEGRWNPPVPWFDIRAGYNRYDYDDDGDYAGNEYGATLAFDNYYLTGNFKFPLSPMRLTVGAYSNGNELQLQSAPGSATYNLGGVDVSADVVGTLYGNTSFESTAPYVGIGFDFEPFGKAGINLDLGVLWQDEPIVSLGASNFDNLSQAEQAILGPLLDAESADLEDDASDFKAWPVVSLTFVYNF